MRSDYAHVHVQVKADDLRPLHKCGNRRDNMGDMSTSKRRRGKGLSGQQADRLRAFLRDTGKNQTELAALAKMNSSTFSRFMGGDTHGSIDMILALSQALGVDLWEAIQMKPADDTNNFTAAIQRLGDSVSREATARVRLLIRLPEDLQDAPIEWWIRELTIEEQRVANRATLDRIPRAEAVSKKR